MFRLHKPLDASLREALSLHDDLTAALLARRGITTAEEAAAFLSPSYDDHVGDPLSMKGMGRAARRIARALDSSERIAVWSDYDCDGVPGGALLHDFLKKADANFTNYIPHRHLEGFGLNTDGIDTLAKDGVSLIITVDCGIADAAPVAHANEVGVDVIITDHHLPNASLPKAYAVVDPKQEGETYPFRDFCGAGLAWKLVCAVLAIGFSTRENIPEGWEKWLLDMAGLATIADMVPLLGENRVIASYGLLVMRKSPRIGFQKLCKTARVNQRFLTEDDVGFMLAPRVNAASRMDDAMAAFELFTTTDESRAEELAKKLESDNRSRRSQGAAVTRAVRTRLEKRLEEGELPPVIAMGDPDWRPGLLGLVANSVAEEHGRPVFLWGREGGATLKGSCRAGVPDVSVVELMETADDVFVECGGHAAAGGFTLRDDAVFFLEEKLCEALEKLPSAGERTGTREADAELLASTRLSSELSRIEKLAPFGMGNPKPSYVLHEINLQKVSWFGKGEEHLRISFLRGNDHTDEIMEAIAFYAKRTLGDRCMKLEPGLTLNVLGNLERDHFTRGRPVRLRLLAIA